MDWFLYDNGLRHERVKVNIEINNNIEIWQTYVYYIGLHKYLKYDFNMSLLTFIEIDFLIKINCKETKRIKLNFFRFIYFHWKKSEN